MGRSVSTTTTTTTTIPKIIIMSSILTTVIVAIAIILITILTVVRRVWHLCAYALPYAMPEPEAIAASLQPPILLALG